MNEAGWREAIRNKTETPAKYAEKYTVPCIGVYDINLLREVLCASSDDQEITIEDRFELGDIEFGDALASLPPSRPFCDAVSHINYPNQSPTDALLALVFIDS
jgi:hypothetical protein